MKAKFADRVAVIPFQADEPVGTERLAALTAPIGLGRKPGRHRARETAD